LQYDVDVKWCGGLIVLELYHIDVILVRVKVGREIVLFSPRRIDIADTFQPTTGEICMDKSHLLPNNPAQQ
jgi:hypothetical protein